MAPKEKITWGGLALIIPLAFLLQSLRLPTDIPPQGTESENGSEQKTSGSHEIDGFSYQCDRDGQRIITIRADRLTIRKKKVGFFRFSLLHEPLLQHGLIQLHDEQLLNRTQVTDSPGERKPSLDQLFSKEALPDLPIKNITSVAIMPVILEMFNGAGEIATRISADSAVIHFSSRDILFKGNVRATSGPRQVLTGSLSLLAEQKVLTTEDRYLLTDQQNRTKGRKLRTDLLLRPATNNLPEEHNTMNPSIEKGGK